MNTVNSEDETFSDESHNSNSTIEITVISDYLIFDNENNITISLPNKSKLFDLENELAKMLIEYPFKRQRISLFTASNKNRSFSSQKLFNGEIFFLEPYKITVGFSYGNIKGFAGYYYHFNQIYDIKKGIVELFQKYKHLNLDLDKIKLYFDEIDLFIGYELENNKKLFEYDYINLYNDEYWKKIIMIYE